MGDGAQKQKQASRPPPKKSTSFRLWRHACIDLKQVQKDDIW